MLEGLRKRFNNASAYAEIMEKECTRHVHIYGGGYPGEQTVHHLSTFIGEFIKPSHKPPPVGGMGRSRETAERVAKIDW